MAGHRRQPNVAEPPVRERDLCDVEMDELRRQVQQLQERLERFEALGHENYNHGGRVGISSNDEEEEINPFYRARSIASNEEDLSNHCARRNNGIRRDHLNIKVDIPEFEGKMQPNEFIDWLNTVKEFLIRWMFQNHKR